jgi:predicted dienelactone hydrolase
MTMDMPAFSGIGARDNRIDTIRPDAPDLAPYGPFSTGVRTISLVNRGQMDIVRAKAGEAIPNYDRPLTVELWYPSKAGTGYTKGSAYSGICTRDGKTLATLNGRALRDAAPDSSKAPYPLVIISHGYPGNRFLLSHLAENLASKGYFVASIDHTDSTYDDMGAFGSTLLNRPLDQLFVIESMAGLDAGSAWNMTGEGAPNPDFAPSAFAGMIQVSSTALVGYSMGGYGVVNTIGGGFTEAVTRHPIAPPGGALSRRQSGNPEYMASLDPRIKAAVAIAPWGWNRGFWDGEGLAGIRTPVFFMAGSADAASGYSPGVRDIFELSVNADRYLLTFENASHNAAAPIPAPRETWPLPGSTVYNAGHYMDPVWDTARMNNIAQHFATAYLGKYLKGDTGMDAYLDLVESGREAVWSVDATGHPMDDHTYWKGFGNRSAVGLRLEHRKARECSAAGDRTDFSRLS